VGTASPGKVKGINRQSANPFFIIGSAGRTAVRTFHLPYYSRIKEYLAQIKRYTYKSAVMKSGIKLSVTDRKQHRLKVKAGM
jgi:hypothetical protein